MRLPPRPCCTGSLGQQPNVYLPCFPHMSEMEMIQDTCAWVCQWDGTCALLGILGMLNKAFCLLINSNAARPKVARISLCITTLCQVDFTFWFSPRGKLLLVNIYCPTSSCQVMRGRYQVTLAGQLQCHPVLVRHVAQHKQGLLILEWENTSYFWLYFVLQLWNVLKRINNKHCIPNRVW